MKKLRIIAGFAMLTLVACQKEQSTLLNDAVPAANASRTVTLVQTEKITGTTFQGKRAEYVYSYDGTKLKQIKDNVTGNVAKFTYNGNNITSWITVSPSGQVVEDKKYTYDANGRVSSVTIKNELQFVAYGDYIINFKYLPNNMVRVETNSFFVDNQEQLWKVENDRVVNINGKNVRYDGRNSPYRNITGFNKILFVATNGIDPTFISSASSNSSGTRGVSQNINNKTLDYTYNELNFPSNIDITKTVFIAGVGTYTFKSKVSYTYKSITR
jgi:YD repeat-containing protein